MTEVLDALNDLLAPHIFPPRPEGGDPRQCPNCDVGKLSLKLGKFGAFVGCSNYPDCRFTRQMTPGGGALGEGGVKVLGTDPVTNLEVTLRSGRFGPYVQLGEAADGEKPKRAGLPKGTELSSVDLDFALGLLALPREVGLHPESGEPIKAGVGRFGPYVQHEKTYANLEQGDEVLNIGLNRAVTLLAEKAARGPSGRRGAPAGRLLGEHPEFGGPVTQHDGRYGPYVKHGKVNATLPSTSDPSNIALEEAIELLKARAEKQGIKQKKAPAKKSAGKKKAKAEDGPATDASIPAGDAAPKKKAAAKKKKKPASKLKAAKKPEKGAADADAVAPVEEAPDEAAE